MSRPEQENDIRSVPLVSIVLTTYNRANLLLRTLEGISRQTFKNFECFIMDDCSSDNSKSCCEGYILEDRRFVYVRQSNNVGMPKNLNDGLDRCNGEFIAILHDDNILRGDLIEKWVTCLGKHETAGFVFNAYLALDDSDQPRREFKEPLPELIPGRGLLEKVFFRRWGFDSPVYGCAMVRKSALKSVGFPREKYGFFADVDLWMRLAMNHDACYVPEPLISLSAVPRKIEQHLWRFEWLIQDMHVDLRRAAFAGRPLRLMLEIFVKSVFRFRKGLYLLAIHLVKGRFKQAPHALAFAIGIRFYD